MIPEFKQNGDRAITVYFENKIDPNVNLRVCALYNDLSENTIKGVTELQMTFNALTVFYDPLKISSKHLQAKIKKRLGRGETLKNAVKRTVVIPVCYESEFALDMENVCTHNSLTADEVIDIHTSRDYLIYMIGFLPGFAYLGGLDERLHTPRLKTPRTSIPSGSVGIGGNQTGMYPLESPGGWQIIGKTPLSLFEPYRKPQIFYSAGDFIRFKAITTDEFEILSADKNAVPEIIEEKI